MGGGQGGRAHVGRGMEEGLTCLGDVMEQYRREPQARGPQRAGMAQSLNKSSSMGTYTAEMCCLHSGEPRSGVGILACRWSSSHCFLV